MRGQSPTRETTYARSSAKLCLGSLFVMSDDTARSVRIERTSVGKYVVHNVRGGSISLGTGQDASFTAVELLLAAIGGCTAADVDLITSRSAALSLRQCRTDDGPTWSSSHCRSGRLVRKKSRIRFFAAAVPNQAAGDHSFQAVKPLCRSSSERGWSLG